MKQSGNFSKTTLKSCFSIYIKLNDNQLYFFFQVIFLNAHNYQQHVCMKKVKLLQLVHFKVKYTILIQIIPPSYFY